MSCPACILCIAVALHTVGLQAEGCSVMVGLGGGDGAGVLAVLQDGVLCWGGFVQGTTNTLWSFIPRVMACTKHWSYGRM